MFLLFQEELRCRSDGAVLDMKRALPRESSERVKRAHSIRTANSTVFKKSYSSMGMRSRSAIDRFAFFQLLEEGKKPETRR